MNSNETNQPLISVIVPVYNIIPYLPRCVESLQKQTYPELEILLIDDGSTDDTPALCDRLAENDPRIRVFHKENGGPSSARNFGLTQAAGAYVLLATCRYSAKERVEGSLSPARSFPSLISCRICSYICWYRHLSLSVRSRIVISYIMLSYFF